MALEHHPDKGGNEETFKKISVAYDTLGDEQKRRDYDNQKNNPFANMGGGGFNPFEDFFGGNPFFQQRKRSTPDKVININVGVVESYLSSDKTITYSRNVECSTCNGAGGTKKTCDTCKKIIKSLPKIRACSCFACQLPPTNNLISKSLIS